MGFEYKEELRELLPDYMELLEEQGKVEGRGNDYWTCPFCDSGNKQNNTAAFHISGTRYKCFACDAGGDIFDLVAHIENLPDDWKKHYNRTLKIMRPYLGGNKPVNVPTVKIPEVPKTEDYARYLHKCHEDVAQTDYFSNRGLSKEIIDRFGLGYDAEKNLVTIPYNPDCKGYVDRVLWDGNSKYYKHGNELFNMNALYETSINAMLTGDKDSVFITEGQIDAMSFMEIGLDAVGLGGVNEVSRLIDRLKKYPCDKILVLALDNDKAGRRATGKFIEELAEADLDQRYIVNSDVYGKYKDANEFLIADRTGFTEKMKEIVK